MDGHHAQKSEATGGVDPGDASGMRGGGASFDHSTYVTGFPSEGLSGLDAATAEKYFTTRCNLSTLGAVVLV
ncbi:hypothetical protein GCM10009650_25760 [Nesterenkonia jeotgali]